MMVLVICHQRIGCRQCVLLESRDFGFRLCCSGLFGLACMLLVDKALESRELVSECDLRVLFPPLECPFSNEDARLNVSIITTCTESKTDTLQTLRNFLDAYFL